MKNKKIIIYFILLIISISIEKTLFIKADTYDNNIIFADTFSTYCTDGFGNNKRTYNIFEYKETADLKVKYDRRYILIDDNNLEKIKELFYNIQNNYEKDKCMVKYDIESGCSCKTKFYNKFDNSFINYGDYIFITDEDNHINIYFYDIETHILYSIKLPNI